MPDHVHENNPSAVASLLEEAYACRVNNLTRSISLAEKALAVSRVLGDLSLIGKSLNQLSLFYMIVGDFDHSIQMAEEAIGYFRQLHDERGIADAKYALAGVYYRTDNYHLGLISLIDCLSIYRKYDDYYNQARVQKSLGTIYEYFGDIKNATRMYEEAIAAGKKTGDLNLESNVYNPLSGIYLKNGKIGQAKEIIERSIAIKMSTGDTRGLAFSLYGRGKVYTKTGHFDEAERDFFEAIRLHEESGDKLGISMTYYKLGVLYLDMNDAVKARDIIAKGIEFSKKYHFVFSLFKCNYLFYRFYKREGNATLALKYLEEYLSYKEAVINTQTLQVIENYELITQMETLEAEARLQKEKAEIIEKKERAEQAARVRQEFLSTMSHEIRTPLNAVTTITSLLKAKADPDEAELLDSLKFASNNLLMIINDILDFTKLDLGKVTLDLHPSNFRVLMENIRRTYDSLAREKGLRLSLVVDGAVGDAYELDETKLSQILGNLIGNAIKYTDFGEVTLYVEKPGESGDTDLLRFRVRDTGIGIAPVYLEEIFDSFFQPKSVTTRKQGGSGLGLAIVKKLVELYGSKIEVTSEEGAGSEFFFTLKLRRSFIRTEVPVKPSLELKDKLVLLAEDNTINAMVARRLLSNWGIASEHAKNGIDAVELSNTRRFDFILMDIHMPEMNGFDAAKQIRCTDNLNKNTPIFALTADVVAEFNENHTPYFSGFLLKPIEIDKLYEALTGYNVNDSPHPRSDVENPLH
jgi:signal transduction histidine kinase/ActR/RegA family two-component response regulator